MGYADEVRRRGSGRVCQQQSASDHCDPEHSLWCGAPVLDSEDTALPGRLVHPVSDVLAAGRAGGDLVAHRLADLDLAEAVRHQHWCCAGTDQGHLVFACTDAWLSPLPNSKVNSRIAAAEASNFV